MKNRLGSLWFRAAAVLGMLAATVELGGCGADKEPAPAAADAAADGSDVPLNQDVSATLDGAADTAAEEPAVVLPPQATMELAGPVGFRLESDAQAKTLQIWRAGESQPRAVWTLDRWQIGTVPAHDPQTNYNPGNLAGNPPEGLRWWKISQADLVKGPQPADGQARVYWRLQTAEVAPATALGPVWLLQADLTPKIGFKLNLRAWSPALAAEWAKDQPGQGAAAQNAGLPMYLRLEHRAPAEEGYYGIGEMMDTPQHRGKVRQLQLEGNFDLDGSSNEGHVRLPLLTGTRGWGWFAQTYRAGIADVAATDPQQVALILNGSEVVLHLLVAEKPLDVIGAYWRLTGSPALPAAWSLGGLLWRNENKDQAEVLQDAADLRKHDLAISGLWIDRPYDTAVNDFGFDPQLFPDAKGMVGQLHDQGLRLGVWSTPYLDPGYAGKPKAKHHEKAKAAGWFVQGPGASSTILKWGPPIDFTHPDAAAFWRTQVQQYADLGIEGYKLDYGEDIVLGIVHVRLPWLFHDGSDERTMHHAYQLGYHAAYAEKLPKLNGLDGGGWILARSSTWGDQAQTSMIWPGDLCAGWVKHAECTADGECHAGGLPSSVSAAISLPTAGFPLFGADTGGYRHGRAPKELFLRWLQHTALTAVLQIGGGSDHHPWLAPAVNNKLTPGSAFDAETLAVSRELIRLHARLFPLLWSELLRASLQWSGTGPLRPLGLAFPQLAGDPGLRAHEADQHLLGEHLLVAPVITPGLTREVWFPPGIWRDWFDGSVHDGGSKGHLETVAAPLTKLPLYVRSGAPVPLLRPTVDTLAPTKDPKVDSFANQRGLLWLQVRGPLQPAQALLWDGTTYGVEVSAGTKVVLKTAAGSEFKQGVRWVLDDLGAAPSSLVVQGKSVPMAASLAAVDACTEACWYADPTTKRVEVQMTFGDAALGW